MVNFFFFFFCYSACGICFPSQGLKLHPLQWECGVVTTGLPGKSWSVSFLFFFSGQFLSQISYVSEFFAIAQKTEKQMMLNGQNDKHTNLWQLSWQSRRSKGQPTLVFLPGKPHRQRSLASYSPWGCKSRTRPSDKIIIISQ